MDEATISDKILRDTVVNELERDAEVNAKHISVTAIDGAITRVTAERAVRQLTGARVVDNLIEVKPPTEPTATDVAPFTGTFTGPLELPDGTVIEPTGKAFEVMFSTIARSRPLRSSLAAVAPGLGVASLAFALWYGAAARALAPYPF